MDSISINEPINIEQIVERSEEKHKIALEIAKLELYEQLLLKKIRIYDPRTYGLPDLFSKKRENETEEEHIKRQNAVLKNFIENDIYLVKNGQRIKIKLFPKILSALSDIIHGRVDKAIWWASRGTGKSLAAALFIFIMAVYLEYSVINVAASEEQSKMVYQYTKAMWNSFPEMSKEIVDGTPLMGETRLKNGQKIMCLESANKAVSKHEKAMVIDEACTGKARVDNDIERGIQGCMSEKDHRIVLLSTFHKSDGLFADYWDCADEKGFARYQWNIFDAMEKCNEGMEFATKEDPASLNFCQTKCQLTWKTEIYDDFDNIIGYTQGGCNGHARTSEGFMGRSEVIKIQNMNIGSNIFRIEFACERPYIGKKVYRPHLVDKSVVNSVRLINNFPLVVGVDWGLTQCSVTCGSWIIIDIPTDDGKIIQKRGLGILDSHFMTNKLENKVIEKVEDWMFKYKKRDVLVYADRSHNYCNMKLADYGWDVVPVDFGKRKEMGIANLVKFFVNERIKILKTTNNIFLTKQLKNLKKDDSGKVIKSNKKNEKGDHGPDSLMCLALPFMFDRMIELEKQGKI